jgi:hypothetical protein
MCVVAGAGLCWLVDAVSLFVFMCVGLCFVYLCLLLLYLYFICVVSLIALSVLWPW